VNDTQLSSFQMLTRRIPLPAPGQPPASALPPHLQRPATAPSAASSTRNPQLPPSRPSTPPINQQQQRPGSPFRNRPQLRPQSPVTSQPSTAPGAAEPSRPPDIDVDLVYIDSNAQNDTVVLGREFSMVFRLAVSALVPSYPGTHRTLSLVVQHVQPAREHDSAADTTVGELSPHHRGKGVITASPAPASARAATRGYSRVDGRAESARATEEDDDGDDDAPLVLPPPFTSATAPPGGVAFIGPSALPLPILRISQSDGASYPDAAEEGGEGGGSGAAVWRRAEREFKLCFVPTRRGFVTLGALRVLLVGDKIGESAAAREPARTLRAWDVIGEVWVR
jgi:hypothetical protein